MSTLGSLPGFLPLAAAIICLSFFKVADPDVFWHLKTGQEILETGHLVRINYFSALHSNYSWPNPEWLFQAVLALTYRAGGWTAVQLFRMGMVLLLGAILYFGMIAVAKRQLLAASLTLLCLSVIRFRFNERPQLFSYILLAVTVLLVEHHRRRGGLALWLLPPLYTLWSNIHPEFLFGLLYLGATALGMVLNDLRPGRGERGVPARIAAITSLSTFATLLNPTGYHALSYPFRHAFVGRVAEVVEYQFSDITRIPLFWACLFLGLALLFLPRNRRDWSEILPALGMCILGVLYIRATPYFLLVTVPAVFRNLTDFSKRRQVEALTFITTTAALIWAIGYDRLIPYHRGWGVDSDVVPVAAAKVLLAHPWQGIIYNNFEDGGYLVFSLFPRHRVLQDGRIPAYPKDFLARLNTRFNAADWPRILDDYQITIALVEVWQARPPFFSIHDWGMVFWDDRRCLLVRRGPANADLLAKLEYRFFIPGWDVMKERDPLALSILASEIDRNQRERFQQSGELANTLGMIKMRLSKWNEAEAHFREAVLIEPTLAPAWANLGLLLADRDRNEEALMALSRALALDSSLKPCARKIAELNLKLKPKL